MAPSATNGVNGTGIQAAGLYQQSSRASSSQAPGEVDTEFFIVGAGPAGASLACFLASHGTSEFLRAYLKDFLLINQQVLRV